MIRVFPRRTKWTPIDDLAFIGDPPLFMPDDQPVRISVTFTWDKPEGERLYKSWARYYKDIKIGGPAYNNPGGEFIPGRFIKEGVVFTSRGCIRNCDFCMVPKREGKLRELEIKDGWIIEDNNLLACSKEHIGKVFEMFKRQPKPIDFAGGLDLRLLKEWHIDLFKSIRLKRLWFAYDNKDTIKLLEKASNLLSEFSREKKNCYVLIGYKDDTLEFAEKRLRTVYNLGFKPFAMLYRGENGLINKNKEWRRFQAVWCRAVGYEMVMKYGKVWTNV